MRVACGVEGVTTPPTEVGLPPAGGDEEMDNPVGAGIPFVVLDEGVAGVGGSYSPPSRGEPSFCKILLL